MISYGEASDRFQAHFVRFANKGEMKYVGGRTFKIEGLEIKPEFIPITIANALVTYKNDRTVITDLDTNEVREIFV